MIRRINFYAGPGAGKSTIAARVFAELKRRHYKVEHVTEWIKLWAILGIKPQSYDQLYILGNQIHEEDVRLRNVPVIVTDSPILLNTAYSTFYQDKHAALLTQMARSFDRDYKGIDLFIDRTVPYEQFGRYQNYQKAVEFDEFLLRFLSQNLDGELIHVQVDHFDSIIELLEQRVFAGRSDVRDEPSTPFHPTCVDDDPYEPHSPMNAVRRFLKKLAFWR